MANCNIEVKVKTTLWIRVIKLLTVFKSKRLINALKGVNICTMSINGKKSYFKFEGI